jgi:1,4-dihydroxy-2-naphthoate octaprenyltransferase
VVLSNPKSEIRNPKSIWVLAARPKTLWAGIVPVAIGTVMAHGIDRLHVLSTICCLLVSMALQIGANFANDYFDFAHGVDDEERVGPVRATQAGLISPGAMRTAFIVAFAIAGILSIYLCYRGGPWLAVIAAAAIASGILYTAGPYPLGYIGLGDLFAFVFFGPIATAGTYFVQTNVLDPNVIIAGCAPGLFSVAMITVNNLRDVEGDKRQGKRTLAVLLGTTFAKWEYVVAILAASLIPTILYMRTGTHDAIMLCALVFLAALPSIRKVFRETGPPLNHVLATSGKLQLLYATIFIIGWLVG